MVENKRKKILLSKLLVKKLSTKYLSHCVLKLSREISKKLFLYDAIRVTSVRPRRVF